MPIILATAISRLHADLIIVRLRQAGVPTTTVSVIHPLSLCPNSALCWLEGSGEIALAAGPKVAIAGSLGKLVFANSEKVATGELSKSLCKLGISLEDSAIIEESLLENRFVLAVELVDSQMKDVVLEIFRRVTAEKVIMSEKARHGTTTSDASGGGRLSERDKDLTLNFHIPVTTDRRGLVSASLANEPRSTALGALLAEACSDLRKLEACAMDMGTSSALPPSAFIRSSEISVLRSVADEGIRAISARLRALGLPGPSRSEIRESSSGSGKRPRRVRSLIGVYRRCSRRLCAALQEARSSSDAATAAVLRGLILRLEKQLWLLDSLSGPSYENRSVVGLFLAS